MRDRIKAAWWILRHGVPSLTVGMAVFDGPVTMRGPMLLQGDVLNAPSGFRREG